jgi:hypothetical protein
MTTVLGITTVIFAILLFSLAFDVLQALKERTKNTPIIGGFFGLLFEVIKGFGQVAVPLLVFVGLAITGFQGVEGLRQCLSDIRRMAPSSCFALSDVTDDVAAPNEFLRSFVGVAYDEQGRFVKFEFFILTRGFYWDQGSSDQIVDGSVTLNREGFQTHVLTPNVRKRIMAAQALISIGLSSQEGDVRDEVGRAG